MCEESGCADGRHLDRTPREEVTVIVERREEGYAQAAVGQRVQQTMTGGAQEKIEPERESAQGWKRNSYCGEEAHSCEDGGEEQRVCEAAMPPEVRVANAEVEADYIEIRDDGAESAHGPDALGSLLAIEAGGDAESGDGVGENRSHDDIIRACGTLPALEKSAVPVGEGAVGG